jgi:hypothetical protein
MSYDRLTPNEPGLAKVGMSRFISGRLLIHFTKGFFMFASKQIKPFLTLGICLGFGTMLGCHSRPEITGNVEEISCTANFKTIESADDRKRIYDVVSNWAERNSVLPAECPNSPVFTLHFKVSDMKTLDTIDAHLRFIDQNDVIQQVLNGSNATASVDYNTITLTGSIKVILTFHVDPGARLYIKPQGEGEREITDSVGPNGDVEYAATIGKGQDYVFARANNGGADKFIKIDIHTLAVIAITKAEYP